MDGEEHEAKGKSKIARRLQQRQSMVTDQCLACLACLAAPSQAASPLSSSRTRTVQARRAEDRGGHGDPHASCRTTLHSAAS